MDSHLTKLVIEISAIFMRKKFSKNLSKIMRNDYFLTKKFLVGVSNMFFVNLKPYDHIVTTKRKNRIGKSTWPLFGVVLPSTVQ